MRPHKCDCNLPTCKICKDRAYYHMRAAKQRELKTLAAPAQAEYPLRHQVIVYECSDGREFSSELEAAHYQLGVYRRVLTERRLA